MPAQRVAWLSAADPPGHGQRRYGHAVLRQGAGFVGAQHADRAQGFDRVDVPGEHAFMRQATRTHGRKQREDHGIFFGQDSHGQRNARQQGRHPLTGAPAQRQHHHHAQHTHQNGQNKDQSGGLLLQRGVGFAHLIQGQANLSDLTAHAGGCDPQSRTAAHHKCAAMHAGGLWGLGGQVAARQWIQCALVHGHRFPSQKGFVHLEVVGLEQPPVCGHPVAFRQQQSVSRNDFAGRYLLHLPIPQHSGLCLRELAQSLDGRLGPAFLVEAQPQHGQHKHRQRQSFGQIAQQHVQQRRCDQQSEHGLAQRVGQTPPQGATRALRHLVGAILCQPCAGLGCCQPLGGVMVVRWVMSCHGHRPVCEHSAMQVLTAVNAGPRCCPMCAHA